MSKYNKTITVLGLFISKRVVRSVGTTRSDSELKVSLFILYDVAFMSLYDHSSKKA